MTGPEAPRVFRVLLEVRDLDEAERFYEALLATKGRRVGGGRIYFDCGEVILAVVDPTTGGEGRVSPLPEALYLATTDLEAVFRRAEELGCLSSELIHDDPESPAGQIVVRPWGERSFYVADPSGNPLCFVDSNTLFTGSEGTTPRPGRPRVREGRTTTPRSRPRRT